MPFERLKQRIEAQSSARDLENEQRLEADRLARAKQDLALNEERQKRQRVEEARELRLTECFDASGIDSLTDHLRTIDPQHPLSKTFYPGYSKSIWHRRLFLPPVEEIIEIYKVIEVGEIKVGFKEDATLIIESKDITQIPERDWRADPSLIEAALEEAHLNPKPIPEPDRSNPSRPPNS